MLQEMKQLQAVCHGSTNAAAYTGVSMKPTDPISFVPFGNSTSAFYCGWIKTHPHYNTVSPWELVVLDSRNHFDYQPNGVYEGGMYRPLVQVLYRMVVRAVTDEVWASITNTHPQSTSYSHPGRASYFWHSEEESDEAFDEDPKTRCYARDGSQDHAASVAGQRMVVLGRPVCFLGSSDPEEPPHGADVQALPRKSCFDGCSEEDFLGVGVYNLDHPIDIQVAREQKRLREAPRHEARVRIDIEDDEYHVGDGDDRKPAPTPTNKSSTDNKCNPWGYLDKMTDPELRKKVMRATSIRRRIAVGERWSALIGTNGKLAMVDTSNQYLWWNTKANSMLRPNEVFTCIDVAGVHMVCLTSQARILTIRGFPPTYSFRSFDKLRKTTDEPLDFVKVSAGENAAAAITKNGKIVYWGSIAINQGGVTRLTVQEPFFVPNMKGIVDINLMGRGLCILHPSGRVSLVTKKEGLRIIEESHKIISVHATGDRNFMLNHQGIVEGLGGRAKGELPLAVTRQMVDNYEKARVKYGEDMRTFPERVAAFRRSIVAHAATCPQCKGKPKLEMDTFPAELQDDGSYSSSRNEMEQVTKTHDGIKHTPEACGAPLLPEDLKERPQSPGSHPNDEAGGQGSIEVPTVLTVGIAHKTALENKDTLSTTPEAWNAVTGPYGCKPGSSAPVVAVSGMNSCSVFLHADGTLSSCGDGKPLCTGLVPPGAQRCNSVFSGRKWGLIGIPLAVEPLCKDAPPTFVSIAVGGAGILAVDEHGLVWGCGDAVGTPDCSELLERLVILQ